MAKVKAKVLCFVDNGLRNPGDVFEYKGPYNHHLEYLDVVEANPDPTPSDVPQPRLRKTKVAEAAGTE
jgi:hypothetical protein